MGSEAIGRSVFAETRWNRQRLDALSSLVYNGEEARETIIVRDPTVDEPIGKIPELSETTVEAAAETARAGATDWSNRSLEDRAEILETFAALAEDHREELLDIVQLETGKSRRHAFEEGIDVPLSADYYAQTARKVLPNESRQSAMPLATKATVEYEPYGVAGIISPWNNPLSMTADTIPALAAGNAVLWKPDEKTPFTALRIAELLYEAGLPEDALTIVTGYGPTVGSALIDEVDYVTFTGGSETGRIVAEQAGRNLIDCSLELSGKNPMIVCEDANLKTAARGAAKGCFTNAGQVCISMERIYVEEPNFDEFLEEFIAVTDSQRLGKSFDYEIDIGSLIDEDQLERVTTHVEDAIERGATLHTGGETRPDIGPYFYEPTIFTDLPEDAVASCEETFGPVVSVEPVASVEEAIERSNDSTHGLNASVWTTDIDRGEAIAGQLEYGTVCINDAYSVAYGTYDAPMGGFKDSGLGRRHGPEGIKKYVQPRTVAASRIGPIDDLPYIPNDIMIRGLDSFSKIQRKFR